MKKKYSLNIRVKAVLSNKLHQLSAVLAKNDKTDVMLIYLRHCLKKKGTRLRVYPFDGVRHYVQNHGGQIRIVEQAAERNVCIPEYFEKSSQRVKKYQSDAVYVAEIGQTEIAGGSDLLLAGKVFLSDALYTDKENRVDIRFGMIQKVWKNKVLVEEPVSFRQVERAIDLVGAASFNYYHLLVEILARLFLVDQYEEYRSYPILVDEVVLKVPQYAAALKAMDKYGHEVICVKKEQKWHVQKLVYASRAVWMPVNLRKRSQILPRDFMVSQMVIENIRNSVPLYGQKPPWRKIFISRRNMKAVRLANEEAICAIFQKYGFEVAYTEEMSFMQQVECFGQAKCIVAASGAALANLVFCQKGARIGCIIPASHRFYLYSTIAYMLGLEPIFLDADIIQRTACIASDLFALDEAYAERYAKSLIPAGRNTFQIHLRSRAYTGNNIGKS